jgi:hypothetical protein
MPRQHSSALRRREGQLCRSLLCSPACMCAAQPLTGELLCVLAQGHSAAVKEAVGASLLGCKAPFRLVQDHSRSGRLEASTLALRKWLFSDQFERYLSLVQACPPSHLWPPAIPWHRPRSSRHLHARLHAGQRSVSSTRMRQGERALDSMPRPGIYQVLLVGARACSQDFRVHRADAGGNGALDNRPAVA